MERKVFCLIAPRRKALKLPPKSARSDDEVLREHFLKACETDPVLSVMTANMLIIFQLRDETGEWCDIEKDDEIENLCEVKVILIPSTVKDVLEKCDSASSPANKLKELQPGVILPIEVDVLYNEPLSNLQEDISDAEIQTENITNNIKEKPVSI